MFKATIFLTSPDLYRLFWDIYNFLCGLPGSWLLLLFWHVHYFDSYRCNWYDLDLFQILDVYFRFLDFAFQWTLPSSFQSLQVLCHHLCCCSFHFQCLFLLFPCCQSFWIFISICCNSKVAIKYLLLSKTACIFFLIFNQFWLEYLWYEFFGTVCCYKVPYQCCIILILFHLFCIKLFYSFANELLAGAFLPCSFIFRLHLLVYFNDICTIINTCSVIIGSRHTSNW